MEDCLQSPTTAANLRDLAMAASHALSLCLAERVPNTIAAPLDTTVAKETEQ